jgi:hypothetical protein
MLFYALLFYSSPARSDDLNLKLTYYLQGNAGESYRDSPSNSGVNGLDLSGNGTGIGFKALGGVNITPMFGAEIGVIGLRNTTIYSPSGPVSYASTLETFQGTFNYPINTDHSWWMVARAGVGATQSKVNISAVNYSSTSDQTPFIAGLGLRIAATPQVDFVIDYDYLGRTGAFQNGGKQSDSLLSLGLRFNF